MCETDNFFEALSSQLNQECEEINMNLSLQDANPADGEAVSPILFPNNSHVLQDDSSQSAKDKLGMVGGFNQQLASNISAQIDEMTRRINDIDGAPPMIAVNVVKPAVNQVDIMRKNNLLDPQYRREFIRSICDTPNDVLSPLLPTTATLSGNVTNMLSIDEHAIDAFQTNDRVVIIKSNFGTKIDPSYEKYLNQKSVKSTRGRKPKAKEVKKERKKPGNGDCFNSQITFVVLSDIPSKKKKTKSGFVEYKFKMFRENKEQLPGAHPNHLDSMLAANYEVIDVLNEALHPGETDPDKKIKLVSLRAEMKNYKFFLYMKPNHIIDLNALKEILYAERIKDSLIEAPSEQLKCKCNERSCNQCFNQNILDKIAADASNTDVAPPHPRIFDVGYTSEDTNLFMLFSTPVSKDPTKTVRVNVFPGSSIDAKYSDDIDIKDGTYGGRINILGAHSEEVTIQIYEYLLYIFKKYYNKLVVSTEVPVDDVVEVITSVPLTRNDSRNIYQGDSYELREEIARYWFYPRIDQPKLSADDLESITKLLLGWLGSSPLPAYCVGSGSTPVAAPSEALQN